MEQIGSNAVSIPTAGRIVHFYGCGNDILCNANGAEYVPAIVVQACGNLIANLQCFTMAVDAPNVLRFSVHHKSEAFIKNEDGTTDQIYSTYWDWPSRN